ncbi:MAG: hypothetical protein ACI4N3_04380, partial [Alphaproteobacteria bacterium]
PKKTIGDIYNCVCDPNGTNSTIAEKIKYIKNFSGLNANTLLGKFKQIETFYNALDTIPEISMLETEIIKAKGAQEENERQNAKREELLTRIKSALQPLIEKEKSLRNDLENDILKNLDLEIHTDKDIQNYLTKNIGNLDKIINTYIDTLRDKKDLTNENLQKYIDDEITLTERNIKKLEQAKEKRDKEKLNSEIENAYKDLLEPLQKLNKLECQIYGGIDVIATTTNKPFNKDNFEYKTIGISGKKITCNSKELTIENIKDNNISITEKNEWKTCIKEKLGIINDNNTGLEEYISKIKEENSCPIKECIHNINNYNDWYDSNNETISKYKGKNTPIINEQLEQCKKAQAEEEAQKTVAKIIEELTKLQNYCCNGNKYRTDRCARDTNPIGNKGNHKVNKTNFDISNIINLIESATKLDCKNNSETINIIFKTVTDTIYTYQGVSNTCEQKQTYLSNFLKINDTEHLYTKFKFCEWKPDNK